MISPRISIGLPVYNGARYLTECLDSLLVQDFEDFEVIISDNASTDGTADICQRYASKDKRFRYSRNTSNIGAEPNYRRVFELARSDLFKWIAHDDSCYPSFLSRCYHAMESTPRSVVLVYPQCHFVGEFGEPINRLSDQLYSNAKQPHRRLARVVGRVSHGGPLWGLIRADCLRLTVLKSQVSYWDDLLLAELALLGELRELPETLFRVRCHSGNAVAVASTQQGEHVAVNVSRANRQTRRALRRWNDTSATTEPIMWIPTHLERCWGYLHRVHHVSMPWNTKILCYLTVVAVCSWRYVFDRGSDCKRALLAAVGWLVRTTRLSGNKA